MNDIEKRLYEAFLPRGWTNWVAFPAPRRKGGEGSGSLENTLVAKQVEVYWNLRKHCFSVRALEGPNKRRVVSHVKHITLIDAKFVVQPAGRERVRREGKKNVHAFVRGRVAKRMWNDYSALLNIQLIDRVTYNPYMYDTFVSTETKEPVFDAAIVELGAVLDEDKRKRFPRILSYHIGLDK